MKRLENKVAIVTGGASGIGEATVRLFLEEGCKVTVADVNQEALDAMSNEYGESVLTLTVDVSKPKEVESMIQKTVAHFGKLDILHNNAGIGGFGLVPDITVEEWKKVFSIDVEGVFYGCKYAIPEMIKNGGGIIVNTASISGLGAEYAMATYNATKGAVINFTRTLANDHGGDNIRANAVCPGPIATPLLNAAIEDKNILKAYQEIIPSGRIGKPEEIAKVVLFLASDESSYVNGTTIVADGGIMARTGQPDIAKKFMENKDVNK